MKVYARSMLTQTDLGANIHKFNDTTKQLLQCLVVMYAFSFRTSSALQTVKSAGLDVFQDDDLWRKFQNAWQSRQSFCKANNRMIFGMFWMIC